MKLLLDYDPLLYQAAAIGEERSIHVVHNNSGDEYDFKTRTEFYGHYKAKAGGWLAEFNKGKENPRLPEEFTIVDVQTPKDVGVAINKIKMDILGIKEATGCSTHYGYSGKGEVFRHNIATILEYKGNRKNSLRPIHLDELKEYLVKHQACEIVTGVEADDMCSIDSFNAYQKWKKSKSDKDKLILAGVDKDYLQCASHFYNTNIGASPCSYDGFGWLSLDAKGDVKGRGRLWLYYQCMAEDSSDNYAANSASAMKWGEKSAYKLLKDAKNDKEAFQALVSGYKTLYPAPKGIVGWRGDTLNIDWLYVLQENFNLAKMLRSLDEKPTEVKEILDKLGVEYE